MTVIDADLAALDPDLQFDDLGSIVARRVSGRFVVDEWGLDTDLRRVVSPLVRARWSLRLEGEAVVPEIGAALLVHNRRVGLSESAVLAAAVGRASDRPLRVTGLPPSIGPFAPLAPLARRLGAVPGNPADLRSLLRAGELVGVPLEREVLHPFHVGPVPVAPVAAALAAGVPIIPVAVLGLELGRWWTVRFGRPLATRRRRAVGDPTELAEATRVELQHLVTDSRRDRT
jgi:hypothetical protein